MGARRFVLPEPGDDLEALAARVLPGVDDAADQLTSWNLHLAMRLGGSRAIGLLPSDIVFIEPPQPKPAQSESAQSESAQSESAQSE